MGNIKYKFRMIKKLLGAVTLLYFIWNIFSGGIGQKNIFMIWNVILAWVPLEIVSLLCYINSKYKKNGLIKIITIFLGILWLLFYPNSTYIITDFIHLSSNQYHLINPNYSPYTREARIIFNDNVNIWLDFVNISIGVWIGYVVGFISLYIIHHSLIKKYNSMVSWILVLIVHILTGFAIFIGRFNRWNSWDIILHPTNIITILQSIVNLKTLKFTLLFGVLSLVVYVINYLVLEIGKLAVSKS
ncbi:DUF1361 domain-containing protein [Clostridium bowmanii]|uniref:DUF1361 domain-containing protein n=1 Tax=Clostridium bowmanii TaxID=132925 RepID=UPI001C0D973F|nr:DUF1361 domain-containing protein [Clostridium bowmanii]MBU3188387.1 DUF1361 domain-containing protein [Clostridium bowmanii]MCA1072776.1 DUF1361 domain-containing protein [Clostridium bowmanii]